MLIPCFIVLIFFCNSAVSQEEGNSFKDEILYGVLCILYAEIMQMYLWIIQMMQAILSQEALRQMGDEEPNTFCTWEFYEYEIQSTPVLKGAK